VIAGSANQGRPVNALFENESTNGSARRYLRLNSPLRCVGASPWHCFHALQQPTEHYRIDVIGETSGHEVLGAPETGASTDQVRSQRHRAATRCRNIRRMPHNKGENARKHRASLSHQASQFVLYVTTLEETGRDQVVANVKAVSTR